LKQILIGLCQICLGLLIVERSRSLPGSKKTFSFPSGLFAEAVVVGPWKIKDYPENDPWSLIPLPKGRDCTVFDLGERNWKGSQVQLLL
jgi:hypothetical protein